MSTLLLWLLSVVSAHAEPLPKFYFEYEPVEGEAATTCTHEQIQDLPDWRVRCETGYGLKTYTAHVIVRENHRQDATGLEVLYWVTEPGPAPTSPPKFHSTSALLHLRGETSLAQISLSQGVENDFASLVLRWKSPAPPSRPKTRR